MSESNENKDLQSVIERVDFLASSFLDDTITEPDFQELEALLATNCVARERYVDAMRLHADLIEHYNPASATEPRAGSPVLGFLGPDDSSFPLPTVDRDPTGPRG